MMITTATKNKRVYLGRQGENGTTVIMFPIKAWINDLGDGTILLEHQRSGDNKPYLCETERDKENLYWKITDNDVKFAGIGTAQITFIVGEKVAKSELIQTVTDRSIDPK